MREGVTAGTQRLSLQDLRQRLEAKRLKMAAEKLREEEAERQPANAFSSSSSEDVAAVMRQRIERFDDGRCAKRSKR